MAFVILSHKICLQANLVKYTLSYCEKMKVSYYVSRRTFFSTNSRSVILGHITNIYTVEEKQKYHITFFCGKNKSNILHSFVGKQKYHYNITFFCGKTKVTYYILLWEKQKYHITFFCGKTKVSYYILLWENKGIILHHVLANSPENVFLLAYVILKLQQ